MQRCLVMGSGGPRTLELHSTAADRQLTAHAVTTSRDGETSVQPMSRQHAELQTPRLKRVAQGSRLTILRLVSVWPSLRIASIATLSLLNRYSLPGILSKLPSMFIPLQSAAVRRRSLRTEPAGIQLRLQAAASRIARASAHADGADVQHCAHATGQAFISSYRCLTAHLLQSSTSSAARL